MRHFDFRSVQCQATTASLRAAFCNLHVVDSIVFGSLNALFAFARRRHVCTWK